MSVFDRSRVYCIYSLEQYKCKFMLFSCRYRRCLASDLSQKGHIFIVYNEQKVLLRDKVIFSLGLSIKPVIVLSINIIAHRFIFVTLIFY